MKLLFIEQHSMKLGDAVFYTIEGRRQTYLQSVEALPVFGGIIGMFFFVGFAYRRPLSSKLYKEAVQSFFLGCACASVYPLYNRKLYLEGVSDAYDMLKLRFRKYPQMEQPDSENAMKNFGYSKWNDDMVEDENDLDMLEVSLFEGDENSHRDSIKQEIMENL